MPDRARKINPVAHGKALSGIVAGDAALRAEHLPIGNGNPRPSVGTNEANPTTAGIGPVRFGQEDTSCDSAPDHSTRS